MENQFSRTALIFGEKAIEKLSASRVIVFGLGGVGGYAVEALVRSGIGAIDIVDDDVICDSNINRQLYALHSTVGKAKVDVAEERIFDINPGCKVKKYKVFFMPESSGQFDFSVYDYVVDCIDTVKGKLEIVVQAKKSGKPVICSMGAGNKVNPCEFKVSDIFDTSVCPLARVMRTELKKRGIKGVKCVFSTEKPLLPGEMLTAENGKKLIPGSNAFTPSVAGLIIAGEVIKNLADFSAHRETE